MTAEGDNRVLMQKVTKEVMEFARKGTVRYRCGVTPVLVLAAIPLLIVGNPECVLGNPLLATVVDETDASQPFFHTVFNVRQLCGLLARRERILFMTLAKSMQVGMCCLSAWRCLTFFAVEDGRWKVSF